MNSQMIEDLFKILENKFSEFKIEKNKKNTHRKGFLEKIENATSNIHLFGLNFPNYITNPDDKIHKTLKDLDYNGSIINVYIYIPSTKIKDEIEKLNVYEKKLQPSNLKRDIYKIQDFENDFKSLNINIIEYDNLYKIGLSAIDLGTKNAFVHLSQVKENELIKDAEYFEIPYSSDTTSLIDTIDELLKRVRNYE